MARAVNSRCGFTGVISGGLSMRRDFSGAGLSSADSWLSVIWHSPKEDTRNRGSRPRPSRPRQDCSEDAVQLGEALVADLERAAAAPVVEGDLRAELALQLFDQVADLRGALFAALLFRQPARLEPLYQRLDRADGEAVGDHLFGRSAQIALVGDGEQGASVAHAQLTGDDGFLDRVREPEQPQRVGDGGTVLPDPRGELFLRQAMLLDQPLVRLRLLDRVEVLALDVLDQRQLEGLLLRDLPDHHRQLAQAGPLRRPPPPLAGDQHVAVVRAADDERQEHAFAADRLGQLLDVAFVEVAAGLVPVGPDLLDAEVQHAFALGWRAARDQRPQTPAQRGPLDLCLCVHMRILLRLRVLANRGVMALQHLGGQLQVALRALRLDV